MEQKFIERRKEYRLPYNQKIIVTDGKRTLSAYAGNISRGGIFIVTLDPFPIDSAVRIAFMLPNQPSSFCIKGRVAHVVFDRQKCEVLCGMGFEFHELNEVHKSNLNLHVMNEKINYMELKSVLEPDKPNMTEVKRYIGRMPTLQGKDLLELRYHVNRICNIFDASVENPFIQPPTKRASANI